MALIRRGPDQSLRQLGVPALGGAIAIVTLIGSVTAAVALTAERLQPVRT